MSKELHKKNNFRVIYNGKFMFQVIQKIPDSRTSDVNYSGAFIFKNANKPHFIIRPAKDLMPG